MLNSSYKLHAEWEQNCIKIIILSSSCHSTLYYKLESVVSYTHAHSVVLVPILATTVATHTKKSLCFFSTAVKKQQKKNNKVGVWLHVGDYSFHC